MSSESIREELTVKSFLKVRPVFGALLFAWVYSSHAIGDICDFPLSPGQCPPEFYAMIYHDGAGQPMGDPTFCNNLEGKFCLHEAADIPPAPAWINCVHTGPQALSCSAYPQGDMKFDWSSSGQVDIEPGLDSSDPTVTVHCMEKIASGILSVTITAPNGYSETVFQGVACTTSRL